MRSVLSDGELRHFSRCGYLVVRGVVPAGVLAKLEAAVDELVANAVSSQVWEAAGASRHSPALRAHAESRTIGALAAQLLSADCVQLLQDTVLVKPAHFRGSVPWHRDRTYTGYLEPTALVSVRLALTPCTRETGCLRVHVGSHRAAPDALRAFTEPGIVASGTEPIDDVEDIELQPGDISLHHASLLHGSGDNRSNQPRKTLVTRLFDARCRLLPERLPAGAAEHFPTLPSGQLDPAAFPVVFRAPTPR